MRLFFSLFIAAVFSGVALSNSYNRRVVVLNPLESFASQVTSENTIYVIKQDFDLHGEDVRIPDNCIFKFQGGAPSRTEGYLVR